MGRDDRDAMRAYFDDYGEREWARLEDSLRGRVSFLVHRAFLERYIAPGMRVLEIGAGPGRFTMELAALGARVVVGDISSVQLDLHRRHVGASTAETSVVARECVDICDLSRFADDSFDAVVAYGGPLSYAFEEAEVALGEMVRVTSPGGVIVASVMSTWGSWRCFIGGVFADAERVSEDANDLALSTGDLRHLGGPHVCRMFRSRDIERMAAVAGVDLVAMSASNWASLSDDPTLFESVEADPDRWSRFVGHEIEACGEPGAVDGGTHLLFALRVRATN